MTIIYEKEGNYFDAVLPITNEDIEYLYSIDWSIIVNTPVLVDDVGNMGILDLLDLHVEKTKARNKFMKYIISNLELTLSQWKKEL